MDRNKNTMHSLSQNVKDGVNGAANVARAVTGDNHRPEAGLGSESRDESGHGCSESTEAEDHGYGMANRILLS